MLLRPHLLRHLLQRRRPHPVPVCRRGHVEEDVEGRTVARPGVEHGHVGHVPAQLALALVEVGQGVLAQELEGDAVRLGLEMCVMNGYFIGRTFYKEFVIV